MDFHIMAKALEVDDETFLFLVEALIKTLNKDLAALKEGYEQKNIKMVIDSSHRIKGSSIQLGFEELSAPAKIIEEQARDGSLDNFSEYLETLEKLSAELIKLHEESKVK